MDVSHLLDNLNQAQREAVSADHLPVLVLAGAGSGKTRVLAHRIAWLIQVEGFSPFSILAVTFTNKAAAEMRHRIEALLGMPAGGMWVGTFHGLAHRLLRRHWEEAKLPQGFQILDGDDQLRMVKRVLKALELDEKRWPPKQAQWFINGQKDEGVRPEYMEDNGDPSQRQMIRIYTAYEEACRRGGMVDFAELLLRALELLRDNDTLLRHYRQRFRALLVDEFQDTNKLQYAWLRLLATPECPIFAVGDDDQSIYGWRGAKIENIRDFNKQFADTQLIRLEQNYRSTGTILRAANAVIANNDNRLGKNLWTAGGEGERIQLYAAFNEHDEARYIANRVQQWQKADNRRDTIAVLYRSNAQSRVLEESFIENAIPYRVYGGLRFFERAEIKDALAYLRIVKNSHDDASFERIVNQPPRGIGGRSLDIVRDAARYQNITLWQASESVIEQGALTTRARNALQRFLLLIQTMRETIEDLELAEQVDQIIRITKLKDHFAKEKGEKGQTRIENLNELVSAANGFRYDPDNEHEAMDDLSAFLSHAALEAGEGQGEAWEDCVQMMTLHAAKGLEFPLVFLCGLEENLFPHQMALNEAGRLEEERRLCYVGITRAEQQLVMSYAEQRRLYGSVKYAEPSQFIGEIPEGLIEEVRPKNKVLRQTYHPAKTTQTRPATDNNGATFVIGQNVQHPRFGEGVIVSSEGNGKHARVEVDFLSEGSKWLVLAYAKLDII